jgi:hypothetical protein
MPDASRGLTHQPARRGMSEAKARRIGSLAAARGGALKKVARVSISRGFDRRLIETTARTPTQTGEKRCESW